MGRAMGACVPWPGHRLVTGWSRVGHELAGWSRDGHGCPSGHSSGPRVGSTAIWPGPTRGLPQRQEGRPSTGLGGAPTSGHLGIRPLLAPALRPTRSRAASLGWKPGLERGAVGHVGRWPSGPLDADGREVAAGILSWCAARRLRTWQDPRASGPAPRTWGRGAGLVCGRSVGRHWAGRSGESGTSCSSSCVV